MTDASNTHSDGFSADILRVLVVGTPGSGKTTLARELSRRLGISHVEADVLRYGSDWVMVSREVFSRRIECELAGECWVADGGFDLVLDLVSPRATNLVWLDYPQRVVMWRLVQRMLQQALAKEKSWKAYRERLWSRISRKIAQIMRAMIKNNKGLQKNPVQVAHPQFPHIKAVRLRSPKATQKWLSGVNPR